MTAPAEPKPAKGLHAKLAAAASELGYISKTGHNDHFRYDFAEASHVVATVREILLPLGVAFHAAVLSTQRIPVGSQTLTQVRMKYTLVDGESGETWDSEWVGEGSDAQDKGIPKALTSALKYWLIQTFLLPLGDDPEADDATDKAAVAPAAARSPARPTAPPAATASAAAVPGNGGAKTASAAQIKYLWALTIRKLGVSGSPEIKAALNTRFGITDLSAMPMGKAKQVIDILQGMSDHGAAPAPVAATVPPDDEPPPPTDDDNFNF